jgi:hypothetical protein
LLARNVLGRPALSEPLRAWLLRASVCAYSLPTAAAKQSGVHALSVLYNIRYLEGARDEMGSWAAFRTLLGARPEEQSPAVRVERGSSSVGA